MAKSQTESLPPGISEPAASSAEAASGECRKGPGEEVVRAAIGDRQPPEGVQDDSGRLLEVLFRLPGALQGARRLVLGHAGGHRVGDEYRVGGTDGDVGLGVEVLP